jgi:hypothetical protein
VWPTSVRDGSDDASTRRLPHCEHTSRLTQSRHQTISCTCAAAELPSVAGGPVCASHALASFLVEKVFVHRRLFPSGPGAK